LPPGPDGSHCEQLLQAAERLEFQGVAGRIEEEHRPLLAGPALETHVGLDDELGAGGIEPLRELLEPLDAEYQAEPRTSP
jgi:hypothetical protein